MKKFVCTLLALIMALSLVACGAKEEETPAPEKEEAPQTEQAPEAEDAFDPSEITLTWASPIINHPVLRTCELGFIDACKELGYKYQIVGSEIGRAHV